MSGSKRLISITSPRRVSSSKTLAEMLPEDYHCGYCGKWHLGDEIVPQRGFSDWISTEDESYRPYYSRPELLRERSDYHHYLVRKGFFTDRAAADGGRIFSRPFAAGMAEPFTKAAFLGREAARFLKKNSGCRPFFLSVNSLEPHPPCSVPSTTSMTLRGFPWVKHF